jgi:hypothetical protein
VLDVAGQVDRGHASGTDLAIQLVATGKSRPEGGDYVHLSSLREDTGQQVGCGVDPGSGVPSQLLAGGTTARTFMANGESRRGSRRRYVSVTSANRRLNHPCFDCTHSVGWT